MSHFNSFTLDYLLNSLWQIPLLFSCAYLASRLLRPLGSSAEHRVWVLALLLQCLVPACSFSMSSLRATLVSLVSGAGPNGGNSVTTIVGPGFTLASLRLSGRLLSDVSLIYGLFLLCVAARFFWRVRAVAALRRTASAAPLSEKTTQFWYRCRDHFDIRTASLAASSRVGSPVTLGLRYKLILLPAAVLSSLREADLSTVLAHESAHMEREDFAKNLLYEFLSLPVSYHPFIWLTRAYLTHTREIVCDQLAADLTGRREYAQSLLRLASLLAVAPPPIAPHTIGMLDAHTFERRLMLLTEKPNECHGPRRALTLAVCAVVAVGTCMAALTLRVSINPAVVLASSASSSPAKVSGGVMAGNLLTHVNPVYPPAAKDAKIQGAVVLHAIIGRDGTIEDLQVVSGPKELLTSAVDAVRQWTYKPFLLNGDPTEVETTITVNYFLQP